MLEKQTNLILAHDLNFETRKSIMDYYKEGFETGFWKVFGFETANIDCRKVQLSSY